MHYDEQLEKIKLEINNLEKSAKRDSTFKPPLTNMDLHDEFEEMVKGVFSDAPEYWEVKKVPGHRSGFDDPEYIRDLKSIRISQRESEENRQELIVQNQETYFLKADTVESFSRIGIEYVHSEGCKDAIDAFRTALKEVPRKDSNQLFASTTFNLGKAYLESGLIENGLLYLVRYCGIQCEGDYYKSVLDKVLKLEYKNVTGNGVTKRIPITGTFAGIKFEIKKSRINFKKQVKTEKQQLDLPYKIPVSLGVEYKDKEMITLLDYQYLVQLDRPSSNSYFYEILLPLESFSVFMEEFYATLLEEKIKVDPLNDLNSLYTELFVARKLYSTLKYYEPKEFGLFKECKSIAWIEVPIEKNKDFLDDFKQFLKIFVLDQKNNEELVRMEVEKVKESYLHQTNFDLAQAWGEYNMEYDHHLRTMGEYANLRVLLYNKEQGIPDSSHNENEKLFNQFKKEYWTLLGEAFSIFEKKKTGQFAGLDFKNHNLESFVEKQWIQMEKMLDIDPPSAIQRARVVLEAMIKEVFKELGYKYVDKDDEELNLKTKFDKIYWALTDDIRSKISRLRFKGNTCNHINAIQRNYQGMNEQLTKEKVQQNLIFLQNIIHYLVKRFRL